MVPERISQSSSEKPESVMQLAHVNGFASYHKCIKQLEKFEYIRLSLSNSYSQTGSIFIIDVDKWRTFLKNIE
jgi:hypothetical protein